LVLSHRYAHAHRINDRGILIPNGDCDDECEARITASQNHAAVAAQTQFTSFTPTQETNWPPLDPFLWENGKMIDLGTLGGAYGTAMALNNQGQVTGSMDLGGDASEHAFLWGRGSLVDLGTLGGDNSEGYFVNNAGEVVGRADMPGSKTHHAFLWRNRQMTDLGVPVGWPCSTAVDINSRGQVIVDTGICGKGGGPGSLWENGGPLVDLNSLVLPGSNIAIRDVGSINDRGEIAANGWLPNGDRHAILLIPAGDCDDECDARITASQNHAAVAAQTQSTSRSSESESAPINSVRNRFGQRYHIPGQRAVPVH
jgi:probable HAF family extracellular repeat protein